MLGEQWREEGIALCTREAKEEILKELPMAKVQSIVNYENYALPLEIVISLDVLKGDKEIVVSRHFSLSGKFGTLASSKAREACLQLKAYIASKEYVVVS